MQDVVKGLSLALVIQGMETSVILPRYGFFEPETIGFQAMNAGLPVEMYYPSKERMEEVSFWHGERNGVKIYLVYVRHSYELMRYKSSVAELLLHVQLTPIFAMRLTVI